MEDISKYNFALNLEDKSSHSYILKSVRPNSTVLEFGAANGIMTRYMKETLGCKIYIIERDVKDGMEAARYADNALIGKDNGDAQNMKWFDKLRDIKFDHIIFADILEHLENPLEVLKKSAELLSKDSSILISVPNISHNAVIIDLINNKFEYRETGLLDKTHIRFFTRSSLLNLIDEAGLKIANEMNTHQLVGHTEFNNRWEDINLHIALELKNKIDGNIYQFVWQLSKKENT